MPDARSANRPGRERYYRHLPEPIRADDMITQRRDSPPNPTVGLTEEDFGARYVGG